MSEIWGYDSENGPHTWHENFPNAAGPRQSPVDISPTVTKASVGPEKLTIEYSTIEKHQASLSNTGHSWCVQVSCGLEKSKLTGGPLQGVYVLEQFHCHWGRTNEDGSEHTVDGNHFAAELHLVHWNSTKYGSFEEAVEQPDGLCVLAVFLTAGEKNDELDKVVRSLHKVKYKHQKVALSCDLNLENYLPGDVGYYTYLGSLTTPPCAECVVWIVFKQPIEVSEEQLEAFRTLKSHREEESHPKTEFKGYMKCNTRPTMPLGSREIREY